MYYSCSHSSSPELSLNFISGVVLWGLEFFFVCVTRKWSEWNTTQERASGVSRVKNTVLMSHLGSVDHQQRFGPLGSEHCHLFLKLCQVTFRRIELSLAKADRGWITEQERGKSTKLSEVIIFSTSGNNVLNVRSKVKGNNIKCIKWTLLKVCMLHSTPSRK